MFKKYLTLILTILFINLSFSTVALAETKPEKEAKFVEKVKLQIAKLGAGTESKVEVKLKDGTKLKGYVSNIGAESFSVTDAKTGAITEVPYPNAKQVKGNNLSNGVMIAIGIGLIAAFVVILVVAGKS